ncbi:hypothetical protein M422DRAFT_43111 [Sphaerobolus stellatus SS14]|nr:hypothetical protein M422DRAFT_43111 [Sphaerobolus stellatus SS14]
MVHGLAASWLATSLVAISRRQGSPTSPSLLHARDAHIIPVNTMDSDTRYYVNITMGGEDFIVEMDTGSSDLWMRKPIPNSKPTNISSSVHYAIGGSVQGPVQLAETSFAGFTVENQAFS